MFELVLAHIYKEYKKNIKTFSDSSWIFLYPLEGLLSIGIFGLYIKKIGAAINPLIFIVVGVIVWNFYAIVQKSITYGITYDIWDGCLKHTLIGKSNENHFILGVSLSGIISAILAFIIMHLVSMRLFNFNILGAGFYLIISLLGVSFFAITIGLIINSLMLRKGSEWMSLVWTTTGIIMVFSGIYYPIDFLPKIAQHVSFMLPTTYSITIIRGALGIAQTDLTKMTLYLIIISTVYLITSIFIYKNSIKKAKERGTILWF